MSGMIPPTVIAQHVDSSDLLCKKKKNINVTRGLLKGALHMHGVPDVCLKLVV